MIRLVYTKASKFKDFTGMLTKISDTVPITVNENGLAVKFLSEDKTTLVTIEMYTESFENIEVEKEVTFEVNTREFNKIAKRATRNDSLELILNDKENVLELTLIDNKTGVRRTFMLEINIIDKAPSMNLNIELPVKAELPASDFKDILSDAKLVGEDIKIQYHEKEIRIRTEEAGRTYEAILREKEPLQLLVSDTDSAFSHYSIDLLQAAIRIASASKYVSLSFGTNMPLRLQFDAPEIGNVTYWVAPRE